MNIRDHSPEAGLKPVGIHGFDLFDIFGILNRECRDDAQRMDTECGRSLDVGCETSPPTGVVATDKKCRLGLLYGHGTPVGCLLPFKHGKISQLC